LSSFITGNRKTKRLNDEMVTAILVPKAATAGQGYFYKLGARRYLVISIGMVAIRLLCGSQQKIAEIAIAVGACSEVATRLNDLEQHLCGQPLVGAADILSPSHFASLSPIDDVRAPASYRIEAVQEAVRRLLVTAGSDMGQLN
jgi:CO/xanthine dehydrogenase FAD-binding subunit